MSAGDFFLRQIEKRGEEYQKRKEKETERLRLLEEKARRGEREWIIHSLLEKGDEEIVRSACSASNDR